MRRMCLALGFLAVLGFIAQTTGGPLPGEVSAAEKVVYDLGWVPYGKDAGFYAALERGLYKAAGLDVTFERGSGDATRTVAAGKRDYGTSGVSTMVLSRSKGVPVKMIAMAHERGMYNVMTLKGSGIRTMKDLEGRNIGVTLGDALHGPFPVVAEVVGIKKWNWVEMQPPMKVPGLLGKKVDAILGYTTMMIPARLQAKKVGEEVVEFLWSDNGVRLPTDGILTHDKTIAEKPEQVRRFLSATLRGEAWAIENPEPAVDLFQKHVPSANRALTKVFWDLSSRFRVWGSVKERGLGHIDRGVMEYTRNLIAKAYKMKDPPGIEDVYTTKLLPDPLPRPRLPGT